MKTEGPEAKKQRGDLPSLSDVVYACVHEPAIFITVRANRAVSDFGAACALPGGFGRTPQERLEAISLEYFDFRGNARVLANVRGCFAKRHGHSTPAVER